MDLEKIDGVIRSANERVSTPLYIRPPHARPGWLRLSFHREDTRFAGCSPNAAEPAVHLIPLPALTDNYIWLLHDDDGNAIVVDPGDAAVVERALVAHRLQLR